MSMIHQVRDSITSIAFTLGYMAALLVLSTIPDTQGAEIIWQQFAIVPVGIQNLAHAPAYGILALFWANTLRNFHLDRLQAAMPAVFIAAIYGGAMELIQAFVPGRHPSALDCFFNIGGALIFVSCYLWGPFSTFSSQTEGPIQ